MIVMMIIIIIIIIIIICQAGVAYDDDNDSYANNYNRYDDNVNYHSYSTIIFSFLFTDASSVFFVFDFGKFSTPSKLAIAGIILCKPTTSNRRLKPYLLIDLHHRARGLIFWIVNNGQDDWASKTQRDKREMNPGPCFSSCHESV